MEKERAGKSVGFFAYEWLRKRKTRPAFSPIFITAGIAVLVLLGVLAWQMSRSVQAGNEPYVPASAADVSTSALPQPEISGSEAQATTTDAATTTDPISEIGPAIMNQLEGAYVSMQEAGIYSSTTAQEVGESLAPYVTANVSYPTFSPSDIPTDADTSYARMLQYRSDLQTSLAPLLKNTEPEYEIFAYYVETKDPSYLTKLQGVAQNYQNAASGTAKLVVPMDAVSYQVGILNAMEEFAATLDAMVAHADDPFASAALLESYDQAESDMLDSFNALAGYEKQKQP